MPFHLLCLFVLTGFVKTAGLSNKTGKFLFCPAKIFTCLTVRQLSCNTFQSPNFNNRLFTFFFKVSFAFAFMFLVKKALKQYHLNTKIILSNPKLLSVEPKFICPVDFPCPGENFCLTDSTSKVLAKTVLNITAQDNLHTSTYRALLCCVIL